VPPAEAAAPDALVSCGMITVYVQQNGETRQTDAVDPAWLQPSSGATLWVDVVKPTPEEGKRLLDGVFHFHPLSIEDALSQIHHPKIEAYGTYLYLILHGINYLEEEHFFATRDVDFFLGANYLVTVHDGVSRSITKIKDMCQAHHRILAEGPVALLHRIVDSMVDNYRPEMRLLEEEMDRLEDEAIIGAHENLMRPILALRRDLASFRRIVMPQRDAIGRLARREFAQISDEMAYRFRDVYDNLVRIADETTMFQDRVSGILDGYLSTISNRLNQVMKVLTVMSTLFLPMTVLTGMWGMNIPIPHFPGGEGLQFWWVTGIMVGMAVTMLWLFRRRHWI
jgi:magnesium transporter